MRLYIILDRVLVHLGLRMDTRDSDQKRNLLEQRKKRLPDFTLAITFQARKDYICQEGVVVQFMLKFSRWIRLSLRAFLCYCPC